ncbi:MAG: helix-turn-helix transcriptional regulator [Oscillospiraceae bacterium]|jgi:DNA-binding Xre family transcriptional regulator|nr:helix-turn-helix transcriptional regulator [Oscillospiraceae bacterium]
MKVSYKRLWHILIDKDMNKTDLRERAKLSTVTMAKLSKCENVGTDVLTRICAVLECRVEDIMEILPERVFNKEQINEA